MNRQATGQKNIFMAHISDKEFVSRIVKEFNQTNKNEQPNKMMGKDL